MEKNVSIKRLTKKEEEAVIIKIIETLLDPSVPFSGKHRRKQWEKGWAENLKDGNYIPKYFGKYNIQRIDGNFVKVDSKLFEYSELHNLVRRLSKKYFRGKNSVYEFGCGTGHNQPFVFFGSPWSEYHGLDWAKSSQMILSKQCLNNYNFDFFKPSKLKLKPNSGVLTVAALEQTGINYKKFVFYLLKNKPAVVVHIEPISELLNPKKLIDFLSIKYIEKRKYLSGYLTYLRELEKDGKIKILKARRSGLGSLFIDGYSIVVWKPI